MRTFIPSFVMLLALCATSGCGGAAKPKGREPVFKVEGTVTYKGKPVAGADIVFRSETVERSAFGRTDEKGYYQLSTFGANDGAVAGKQTVIITKMGSAGPATPEPSVDSAEYVPPGYETVKPAAKLESQIPAKYADPAKSGLVVNVSDDGNVNKIDFELKD